MSTFIAIITKCQVTLQGYDLLLIDKRKKLDIRFCLSKNAHDEICSYEIVNLNEFNEPNQVMEGQQETDESINKITDSIAKTRTISFVDR